jgi:hypothetical protein
MQDFPSSMRHVLQSISNAICIIKLESAKRNGIDTGKTCKRMLISKGTVVGWSDVAGPADEDHENSAGKLTAMLLTSDSWPVEPGH